MSHAASPHRSSSVSGASRRATLFVLTVVLGIVGQLTFYAPAQISLVWPVSGVALIWLLASTPRTLGLDAGLLAVAAALSVLLGIGGLDRAVFGAVLTVVPTVCMLLVLRRFQRWGDGAEPGTSAMTLADLAPLGVAVLVGGAVSAALRASGLGLIDPSGTANALLTAVRTVAWAFVPTAVALSWVHGRARAPRRPVVSLETTARVAEWGVVAGLTVGSMWLLFTSPDPLPVLYPTFLVAVWASLRTTTAVAALVTSAVGLLAIAFTLSGEGPFVAVADPRAGAALAQGFMVCLTLVSLIMSLALQDRRSALQRAEEATEEAHSRADLLDAVVANITEGILVVQDDDVVLLRNDTSRRLVPAADDGPTSGRAGPYELWNGDGSQVDPDQLPSRLALDGQEHALRDFQVLRDEEVLRTLEVGATRLPHLKDQPARAVVTFRDVSRERTERSELEAFAGVVAHDLANPLTIITGWSEALGFDAGGSSAMDPSEVTAIADRIMAASAQMHTFIDDLLSFTMTRNQALRTEDVDLSSLCEEVSRMRRQTRPDAEIVVQPGMRALGDRGLLRQLLDNLVGNALKYVADGVSPVVRVSAEPTAAGLQMSVRDNGIGIPVPDRSRVFGDFYRVDSARGQYQGTGLGLAICSTQPSVATGVRARSVLIVDDVAETRELVRWQLSRDSELQVVGEAVDGDSAVREAVRLRPDVVILDLMMPTQGGLETIPLLRRAVPDTQVVAMTSYDSLDTQSRALELGAACYVVKGTRRADFVRVVRQAAGLAT